MVMLAMQSMLAQQSLIATCEDLGTLLAAVGCSSGGQPRSGDADWWVFGSRIVTDDEVRWLINPCDGPPFPACVAGFWPFTMNARRLYKHSLGRANPQLLQARA